LITEIKYRFETKNTNISNLKGFIPKYCNNIDVSKMLDAALLYTTDLSGTINELEGELKTWKAIWKEKPVDELPSTALETIFLPLMNYYPNIKWFLMHLQLFLQQHAHLKVHSHHLRELKPT